MQLKLACASRPAEPHLVTTVCAPSSPRTLQSTSAQRDATQRPRPTEAHAAPPLVLRPTARRELRPAPPWLRPAPPRIQLRPTQVAPRPAATRVAPAGQDPTQLRPVRPAPLRPESRPVLRPIPGPELLCRVLSDRPPPVWHSVCDQPEPRGRDPWPAGQMLGAMADLALAPVTRQVSGRAAPAAVPSGPERGQPLAATVAELSVLDASGRQVSFGALFRERRVIVVFVRVSAGRGAAQSRDLAAGWDGGCFCSLGWGTSGP